MEFFSTITAFDATVLAIIGFSAFRGISRGFTTELLTLVSWFGALMITLYGIGFGASDFTRQYIKPESLADVVTVMGLFLLSFTSATQVWPGCVEYPPHGNSPRGPVPVEVRRASP